MNLNRARPVVLGRRPGFVRDQQYFCLQKRTLPVQFQHLEALLSLRDQIETPVGILLRNAHNLRGASNFGDALVHRAYHAKWRVVCPALADHFFVSRLKNVEGHGSAGEQNKVKREKGYKGKEFSRG